MSVFRDESGRNWIVEITVLDVKILRESSDPKINLTDTDNLGRLFDDESLQYVVLWQLVKAQAEKAEVDEVEFARIFTKHFIEATKAFIEALQNFFQQTGRLELKELIGKILNASTRLRSVVEKNLRSDKFSQVLDKVVLDEETRLSREMDKHLGIGTTTLSSGSSPES